MFDFLKINKDANGLKAALSLVDSGKLKLITWTVKITANLTDVHTLYPDPNYTELSDPSPKDILLTLIFTMNSRTLRKFVKFINQGSPDEMSYLKHFRHHMLYLVSCDSGPDVHSFAITKDREILLDWIFSDVLSNDNKIFYIEKFFGKTVDECLKQCR